MKQNKFSTKNEPAFFELIQVAIGIRNGLSIIPTTHLWKQLIPMLQKQRLCGICLDGISLLPEGKRPPHDVLMKCIGQTVMLERVYEQQNKTVCRLSSFFSDHGLRMVLMKGYGLSKNYPNHAHRGCGDIDIYFCGKGQYADELIEMLGIKVKQNEEKHSVYDYKGTHVENHASIICEQEHPSLRKVEKFLKKELNNNIYLDTETGCWLPSAMFNAVFLPLHFAGHFVYGGANLRQIVDYALVIKNAYLNPDSNKIDWKKVKALSVEGGYLEFLCCLNGICMDYIGFSAEYFPDWPRNKMMEERILNEILNPASVDTSSLFGKIRKYFGNRWKYKLVYSKENYLTGFLLRTHSWLNWKWGKKSVWTN